MGTTAGWPGSGFEHAVSATHCRWRSKDLMMMSGLGRMTRGARNGEAAEGKGEKEREGGGEGRKKNEVQKNPKRLVGVQRRLKKRQCMALREEGKGFGVGGPGSSWSRCLAWALSLPSSCVEGPRPVEDGCWRGQKLRARLCLRGGRGKELGLEHGFEEKRALSKGRRKRRGCRGLGIASGFLLICWCGGRRPCLRPR